MLSARLRHGGLAVLWAGVLFAAASPLPAQTLFGNRGPLGRQRGGETAGGSMFSRQAGFAGSAAVRDAESAGGGFIGRRSQADRFIGSRAAGQAGGTVPAVRREAAPASSAPAIPPRDTGNGEAARPAGTARRARSARTQLAIAFPYPQTDAGEIAERLSALFANLAGSHPQLARVVPQVDAGGRVTLGGRVPDRDAARLAAALVRLQPGVRGVDNVLLVAPAD